MHDATAQGLWTAFMPLLRTSLAFAEPESRPGQPALNASLTVTNDSNAGPRIPRVVFTNVELHLKTPTKEHRFDVGRLEPRQTSRAFVVSVPLHEALDVHAWTTSRLDTEESFSFESEPRPARGGTTDLEGVVRLFNRVRVHAPLAALRALPRHGALSTPLAVETVRDALRHIASSVRAAQRLLDANFGFDVRMPSEIERARLSDFKRRVGNYADSVERVCAELASNTPGPQPERFPALLEAAREELSQNAARLNETTERLMADYSWTDERVDYAYREAPP
ncbi:MAG: hypothetical protein FJ318_04730 [SAR202 cluster bacterium]|nr:hypothetical protein [SAR202 cluster bacterium]